MSQGTKQPFCTGAKTVYPLQKFSEQSQSIVSVSDVLIAAPDGFRERFRGSGTWMTVRRGRAARKTIVFCYPDGSREAEVAE